MTDNPVPTSDAESYLDQLCWTSEGLLPAIAQDHISGDILMMAWMNRQSLALSVAENRAVYWSRSRQKLWRKGEESGHVQQIKEIRMDCDADVIILKVEQIGGIACHTGRRSCFYRRLEQGTWQTIEPVIKDPDSIYK
jgi:phosphoribosyl-AMP cyclohydrolase